VARSQLIRRGVAYLQADAKLMLELIKAAQMTAK
jgi:hypothetical protein